jgi:hypothetical protein
MCLRDASQWYSVRFTFENIRRLLLVVVCYEIDDSPSVGTRVANIEREIKSKPVERICGPHKHPSGSTSFWEPTGCFTTLNKEEFDRQADGSPRVTYRHPDLSSLLKSARI